MNFQDLKLIDPLLLALQKSGYQKPTPIQEKAIPPILSQQDLLGIAQTGTGKTAAFCLPILQILSLKPKRPEPKHPRVLILTPTRELAIQIHKNLQTYGENLKLRHAVVFGGVGQGNQVRDLSHGADILVATPGRLLDLVQQRHLFLNKIEIFVLDEADRMLDMGFIRDIRKILPLLPPKTHNLFFSATMPPEIQKLSSSILKNPIQVQVTPVSSTAEKVSQSVYFVDKKDKGNLLVQLLKNNLLYKVLVFVRMKHGADRVVEKLQANRIEAMAIHGNKSQNARQRAIEAFSKDQVRVLVATDIASRGIDIDGITHVINYELPNVSEDYVHRIGRTARAGASGEAISLCTIEEKAYLQSIEKLTKQKIAVVRDHHYHSNDIELAPTMSVGKAKAIIEGGNRSGKGSRRPFRGSGKKRFSKKKNH